MKLTHQEYERRAEIVYLKKEERNYYNLEITAQHLEIYEQYLSGQLNDQEFAECLINLIQK